MMCHRIGLPPISTIAWASPRSRLRGGYPNHLRGSRLAQQPLFPWAAVMPLSHLTCAHQTQSRRTRMPQATSACGNGRDGALSILTVARTPACHENLLQHGIEDHRCMARRSATLRHVPMWGAQARLVMSSASARMVRGKFAAESPGGLTACHRSRDSSPRFARVLGQARHAATTR